MTFKKKLQTMILYIVIFYLLLSAVFNLLIDPYGKYNLVNVKGINRYKYNYEQQDVLNRIFEDNKIDTLVFGTSRSATMGNEDHFTKNGSSVLNLSDAIYGNPEDIYNYLTFALKKTSTIKQIFIGIDLHVYEKKNRLGKIRNDLYYTFPYMYSFLSSIAKLTPIYNSISFYSMNKNIRGEEPKAPQDNNGVREYLHKKLTVKQIELAKHKKPKKLIYTKIDLDYFEKIDNLLRENEVNVYFYTFPNSVWYYDSVYSLNEVNSFYGELRKYISFYNFSYINFTTKDAKNYYDISHYGKKLNALILKSIFSGHSSATINGDMLFKKIEKI